MSNEQKFRLGASDIPTLLGINPFQTPLDLWNKKKSGEKTEHTDSMLKGELLEDDIIEIFRKATGYTVIHNTGENRKMYSALDGKLVCIPDGFVITEDNQEIPIEVKFTSRKDLTPMYIVQLSAELYIMDKSYGYVIICTPEMLEEKDVSSMFRCIVVERDEKFDMEMLSAIQDFIQSLIDDECIYVKEENLSLEEHVPILEIPGIDDLCSKYEKLSEQINELNKEKNILRKQLDIKLDGKDYVRGKEFGIKKISRENEGCLEVDVSFKNILQKFSIPFILKEPSKVSYPKVIKIKGDN